MLNMCVRTYLKHVKYMYMFNMCGFKHVFNLWIYLCSFVGQSVLGQLSHLEDLLLWVGVPRRPWCVNIIFSDQDLLRQS